jgi:hypothetical protein
MQTFLTLEMSRQRRDHLVRQADEYRLTHPSRPGRTRPAARRPHRARPDDPIG